MAMIHASPDKGYSHGYYCLCIEGEKVEEAIKAGVLTAEEGDRERRRVEAAKAAEWHVVWNRHVRHIRERGRR